MTPYPTRYPNTTCMYENAMLAPDPPTRPGIDMNVTPLRDAPIMPIATSSQGDLLLALKNVALSDFRDVNQDITDKKMKYRTTIKMINPGETLFCIVFEYE